MVVEKSGYECKNCFFYNKPCSLMLDVIGLCCGRTDKKYVTFIKQPQELNLCKILKDCPKGTKLYSTVLGYVIFQGILAGAVYPIIVTCENGVTEDFTADGKMFIDYDGECTLFPSKEQRSWADFIAPWYKKERFDPKTLKAFDRVLCKNGLDMWRCDFFSSYMETYACPNVCIGGCYIFCIPYNDETKHLVGTTDEAPDFYRYWED